MSTGRPKPRKSTNSSYTKVEPSDPISASGTPPNELDWATTLHHIKEWSHHTLLEHLYSKSFSIGAREYNPSAPFVYVRTEDGVTTTLPHGYRLPLVFIAKFQWETICRALNSVAALSASASSSSSPTFQGSVLKDWLEQREEMLHLSRMCHTLFRRARIKQESGGMEKGWRCIMFDRMLARFYKGWPYSSPKNAKLFVDKWGIKEYDRDVLKHGVLTFLDALFPPPINFFAYEREGLICYVSVQTGSDGSSGALQIYGSPKTKS
ncbi:hypothetical protein B0H34DRAFT_276679 [Crassisporium funariophilum]|nr:hypothetical protein B0H34DRAFT_276679 [Crassisporium funariophilum]